MVLKQYCCWTWGSFVVHEVHNTIIPAMVLPGDCFVLGSYGYVANTFQPPDNLQAITKKGLDTLVPGLIEIRYFSYLVAFVKFSTT